MKLGLARSIRDGAALGWAIAASLELWAIALLSSYVHVNFMVADHF